MIVVYLPSLASFRSTWLEDRLRVGVDDGANLDAPSSLSGEPAERTPVRR